MEDREWHYSSCPVPWACTRASVFHYPLPSILYPLILFLLAPFANAGAPTTQPVSF
jgi:hypothetical protein